MSFDEILVCSTIMAITAAAVGFQPSAAATSKSTPIDIENDRGAWLPVSAKIPLFKNLFGYIECQPRWQKLHVSPFSENQMRAGIGYDINKNLSIAGGYFWSAHFDPTLNSEHRSGQARRPGRLRLGN